MKNVRNMFIALAASFAAVSCMDNALPEVEQKGRTFRVTCGIEAEVDTKAALGEDGYTVEWQENDQFTVYYKVGDEYKSVVADIVSFEGKSAEFEYTVPEADADLTQLFAVYGPSHSESVIGYNNELEAVKDGFDSKGISMCAIYSGNPDTPSFAFKNFSSLLKVNITNNLTKATLSKIAITVNNPGRYKEFNKKVTWWEYDEEKGQIVTGSKTSESLLDPITVTGTFETGTYYIPVLGDGSNVYQISIHFYDANDNVKTLTQKYSVKPATGKIIKFGDFTVVDSWFPIPEEPGQPEVGVLYESAFDVEGTTNVSSFLKTGSAEIDNVTWSLGYALLTTYYPIDGTSHLLLSVRKGQTEAYAESSNLLTETKTVTSFTVKLSRKTDYNQCEISYYDGTEWVIADSALKPSVSSKAAYDYDYALATPVETDDFRVKVRYYSEAAETAHRFLHFEGVKVMGY